MLTTPALRRPIRPFNANADQEIQFYTEGGAQVLRNRLIVTDNHTDVEAYNSTQETFAYHHIISANTLVNGNEYTVSVQTGGNDNKWSMKSEEELFLCLAPAVITIPDSIIDTTNQNRVGNETVLFEANYEQAQGEIVESYQYFLYDGNKSLLTTFDEVFHNSTEPLKQEIAGLADGELYHVEVKTESTNGLLSSTGLIWFTPHYRTPRLTATLVAENQEEKGAIKLSSVIVQIVGELYDPEGDIIPLDEVEYIDGEWLDLTRADYQKVVFDKGFETIGSDYTMKLWFKTLENKVLLMRIEGPEGMVEVFRVDNAIVAFKKHRGMENYAKFASDDFEYKSDQKYMLQIRQVNNMIDLEVFEAEEGDLI